MLQPVSVRCWGAGLLHWEAAVEAAGRGRQLLRCWWSCQGPAGRKHLLRHDQSSASDGIAHILPALTYQAIALTTCMGQIAFAQENSVSGLEELYVLQIFF